MVAVAAAGSSARCREDGSFWWASVRAQIAEASAHANSTDAIEMEY
jgi:hypothetical protein